MNFKDFTKEMQPLHNHICIIHDMHLGRLVGVHEDEIDYYYTILTIKGNIVYYSAVGACISLKSIERYEMLNNSFQKRISFSITNE